MTSAWAPTAKDTALAVPTPLAIRMAAPAPGSSKVHEVEQNALIDAAFSGGDR